MKTPRVPLDQYDTPLHYTQALEKVIGPPKGILYDPCCGDGDIIRALDVSKVTDLFLNDIDPRKPKRLSGQFAIPNVWHRDVTFAHRWGELGFDWIISNPPFSHELEILTLALKYGKNVAFLGRLSFLEPTLGRRLFWARHQAGLELIVLPRYKFRAPNKDMMTCAWFIWREKKSEQRVTISRARPRIGD